MLIYLDMCCLKRPFDDQSQPRIHLESEAVLMLLNMESIAIRFVRSAALTLENMHNPVKERASRVQQWLDAEPYSTTDQQAILARTNELIGMGFKSFDALHLCTAEQVGADRFATCDDRLLAVATRNRHRLNVQVVQVLDIAKEFTQ